MRTRGVRVRYVLAGEHDRLRQLRLASLAADPDAFGSTYAKEADEPAEWWQRWAAQSELGTNQRTLVLEADDGRWLALALVRLDDGKPGAAVLNAMWVAPEARGQRAAALLCDACATWATDVGCHQMTLEVVVDNRAARRAYEAAGFVISGRTSWSRDDRTLDEFVMTRSL
jgi:RimJ/RimL family protein N-acetyltransferase